MKNMDTKIEVTETKVTISATEKSLLKLILEAKYELHSQRVSESDTVVAFGPLVKMFIERELIEQAMSMRYRGQMNTLLGCHVNDEHFNNDEIVLFDRSDLYRERKVIVKIELKIK